jgi:hypothetical protein
MSLLVNLKRGNEELQLGAFAEVILAFDELRAGDNSFLARHRNNRWYAGGEEYSSLEITGPLVVKGPSNEVLGPYMNSSMFDGVSYVDRRVFAFTDVQREDWYVHDAGVHWTEMRISFHRTGP